MRTKETDLRTMKAIGERIRKRREEYGISAYEFAKLLGYSSENSVRKIESGEQDTYITTLIKICEILHCSPMDILQCSPATKEQEDITTKVYNTRIFFDLETKSQEQLLKYYEFIKNNKEGV